MRRLGMQIFERKVALVVEKANSDLKCNICSTQLKQDAVIFESEAFLCSHECLTIYANGD